MGLQRRSQREETVNLTTSPSGAVILATAFGAVYPQNQLEAVASVRQVKTDFVGGQAQGDGVCAVAGAQLLDEIAHMALDGCRRHSESRCDPGRAHAPRDHPEYFTFALGEEPSG